MEITLGQLLVIILSIRAFSDDTQGGTIRRAYIMFPNADVSDTI